MRSNGIGYISGTSAKNLEYENIDENRVLHKKKKRMNYGVLKTKLVLSLFMMFALGFVLIYRYSMITEFNYNLDQLKNQYKNIQNENVNVKVKIDNSLDLATIKDVAENKLFMHKPEKYQQVYLDISKNDYTKVNIEGIENKSNVVTFVQNLFNGYTGVIR